MGGYFSLFDAAGGRIRGGGEFVLFFPKNQNMARVLGVSFHQFLT